MDRRLLKAIVNLYENSYAYVKVNGKLGKGVSCCYGCLMCLWMKLWKKLMYIRWCHHELTNWRMGDSMKIIQHF